MAVACAALMIVQTAGARCAETRANAAPARSSTLEAVKAQGFVRCGSVPRPGLATTDGRGRWSGLEVEICRAVALAVFGDEARFAYHAYGSDKDFDAVRTGADQVAFLTFAEMAERKVVDTVLPGPPVFIESLDMIVAASSPAKGFAELAGKGICFIVGTAAETALEAWFHDRKLEFVPYPFQEDGEEIDTFNVQTCPAMVGEATELGGARQDRGVNNLGSRYVGGHLLSFPVLATTPLAADARWAAIVAWTIDTLINADAHETDYHASGLRAMAVPGAGLGLAADWQKTVVDKVGSYSDIFRRSLGAGSPLQLEQGLNRRVADGGVLLAPFRN